MNESTSIRDGEEDSKSGNFGAASQISSNSSLKRSPTSYFIQMVTFSSFI